MKEYILKVLVVSFASILFTNCNDEFLERYPLDRISNETFWNTGNDLEVYNNTFYDIARDNTTVPLFLGGHGEDYESANQSFFNNDYFSDNLVPGIMHELFKNVRAGVHTVPANPNWFGYSGWNFIRTINIGLENYDRADISQSTIDKYAGEARFLRGWFYAEKVLKFGDVHWFDKELNIDSEILFAKRTPREEVMEKVLEDLTFACEKLPDNWNAGSPGRLNRWAALLVKSRACLYEGTWRKYHGGSNPDMWLQEAADAAKELIEDGPYSLYNTGNPKQDYSAYHKVSDLSNNPEVIYWRKYDISTIYHMEGRWLDYAGGGATKNFIEDYLCTDGLPITLSPLYKGDEVYENIFENRDPRLRQTILHPDDVDSLVYGFGPGYSYPLLKGMGVGYNSTGYHTVKHWTPNDAATGWSEQQSILAAIILRFGEALLNYAEAKAELGTITQADLDMSINMLRDRAGMPHMDLNNIPVDPRYVNDGVSPLIVEIRRERRIELFNEGCFRYEDLRRWKQGKKLEIPSLGMRWDEANSSRFDPDGEAIVQTREFGGVKYIDPYKGTAWENPVFDESKHYIWPIPLREISENDNIVQNPNW
jgi:starch-binding outer membrane protein, SusD/RagB family